MVSALDELDFNADHFALFGLPPLFRVDSLSLDKRFREIQARVHPDRFAHAGESERRVSLQWATRVNEAYQTLKNPLARAQYLLELAGRRADTESNTSMPPEFLMEQMEWREAVEEARAAGELAELEKLHARLLHHAREVRAALERQLDADHDYAEAADTVRRLMFIEKLQHEIDDALLALEG